MAIVQEGTPLTCGKYTKSDYSVYAPADMPLEVLSAVDLDQRVSRAVKIVSSGEALPVSSPVCGQPWYHWNSAGIEGLSQYDGQPVDMRDPRQLEMLSKYGVRFVVCKTYDCAPVEACACENDAASTVLYTLGVCAAIVVERIEYNKKQRGIHHNHGAAVALVCLVLLLAVLSGPVGKPHATMLIVAAIVFIGMSIIGGRRMSQYSMTGTPNHSGGYRDMRDLTAYQKEKLMQGYA